MIITHAINNGEIGGAQKLIVDLINTNINKEITFQIITLKKSKKNIFKKDIKNNIKIFHLSMIFSKDIFLLLKALINTDIFHVHLFPSLYLFAFFKQKKIFTEHSTFNRRRNFFFFKILDKFFYSRYSKIICISHGVKNSLINWLGNQIDFKIIVIYNGIKINFKNTILQNYKNKNNIGMIGNFINSKNQMFLIKLIKYLPSRYKLFLLGYGPNLPRLKKEINILRLNKRVIIFEQNIDSKMFFKKIGLYVQSSNWEGFGLAALEAMNNYLPTFTSNIEGIKELYNSKYLLFSNDKNELARKIFFCNSNFINYQKLAIISKKNSSYFNINRTNIFLNRCYRELI